MHQKNLCELSQHWIYQDIMSTGYLWPLQFQEVLQVAAAGFQTFVSTENCSVCVFWTWVSELLRHKRCITDCSGWDSGDDQKHSLCPCFLRRHIPVCHLVKFPWVEFTVSFHWVVVMVGWLVGLWRVLCRSSSGWCWTHCIASADSRCVPQGLAVLLQYVLLFFDNERSLCVAGAWFLCHTCMSGPVASVA